MNQKNSYKFAKQALQDGLSPFWQGIHGQLMTTLAKDYASWLARAGITADRGNDAQKNRQICEFLAIRLDDLLERTTSHQNRYSLFIRQMKNAISVDEQWQHQSAFLRALGRNAQQVRSANKARKRWFDNNAILDLYQESLAQLEAEIRFILQRFTALLTKYGAEQGSDKVLELISAVNLSNLVARLFKQNQHSLTIIDTLDLLSNIADTLGLDETQLNLIHVQPVIYQYASDTNNSVQLQAAAIKLLLALKNRNIGQLILFRFQTPVAHRDAFFLRAKLVHSALSKTGLFSKDQYQALIMSMLKDGSVFVRQALIAELSTLAASEELSQAANLDGLVKAFAQSESNSQVQVYFWDKFVGLLKVTSNQSEYLSWYKQALFEAQDEFVLRILMEIANDIYIALPANQDEFYGFTYKHLSTINTGHEMTHVRRWAAKARQDLWLSHHKSSSWIPSNELVRLKLGETIKIKRPIDVSNDDIMRTLSSFASKQHGFDVNLGRRWIKVTAGYRLRFRLWRWLHELRHPATDKRQNYRHTTGRVYYGLNQAPTDKLAEMSQTKVPGEPLHIDDEAGWRPYLPLLDQILSSLDQGWPTRPVKLYTPEGITEIFPPKHFVRRLWAKWVINYRFKQFAALRNWHEASKFAANEYLAVLSQLGFRFSISGYESTHNVDDRVTRFFPSFVPVFTFADMWRDLQQYFYSVYQNSLQQLTLFLVSVTAIFFGQHFWLNQRFRWSRNAIPYVIGGWGTRGKSGTERLKAALFNGQGVSILSKSTGCEALFLYAPENRPLKELFLFRPYDKASIWEQLHLTGLAAKLNVKLMLWECMGLNPRYIEILQQQWMRDDIATITNCYPDHEDIQGPAGIDIPKVMTRFVPKNSVLVSSEDSMSPLLESTAYQRGTEFHQVGWRDGFTLSPDVLDRFPYAEHPTNIALVLRLAALVGIAQDEALRTMADFVVPDLGVLKVYPASEIDGRFMQFINGMSANERLAALGNWTRLEMDKLTCEENPDVWLGVVINNRADRVSRSKVFASILANDIKTDSYFLIGDNLDGLYSYIEEAWNERIEQMFSSINENEYIERFNEICFELRTVTNLDQIRARINAMLSGLGMSELVIQANPTAEHIHSIAANSLLASHHGRAILCFYEASIQELTAYQKLLSLLSTSKSIDVEELKAFLWLSFSKRIHVVEDYHIAGSDLIQLMAAQTPPGLTTKIMGMQNIKGTGLDFVYQWQGWDDIYREGEKVRTGTAAIAQEAIKGLANLPDYSPLAQHYLQALCQEMRDKKVAQTELFQAELNIIEGKLTPIELVFSQADQEQSKEKHSVTKSWVAMFESFFDAGQAIKRRKVADKIYNDLANKDIGLDRAVLELKQINKAQKGGWLAKKIGGRVN